MENTDDKKPFITIALLICGARCGLFFPAAEFEKYGFFYSARCSCLRPV